MNNFEIFPISRGKIADALLLAKQVFDEEIAPSYSEEGVEEFHRFIELDSMLGAVDRNEMFFFGAHLDGGVHGIIAVKNTGHISLFFVEKNWQNQGVGSALFHMAYEYCATVLHVNRMTVNAAPSAVSKYAHMGFRQVSSAQTVHGIEFVPMEVYVSMGRIADSSNQKNSKIAKIVLIVCLVWIAFLIIGVVTLRVYKGSDNQTYYSQEEENDNLDPMNPESGFEENRGQGDEEDDSAVSGSGIFAIPEKIDDALSYEIEEEQYTYNGEKEQNLLIDFQVKYPELDDLDGGVEKKVNALIKERAMETVDKIYQNPSMEFKDKMLTESNPVLFCYVQYKVVYANADFISIAFEEQSAEGSRNDIYLHLRTINIDLKTGKEYQVKDIVNLNADFMEEWIQGMRNETGNQQYLKEFDLNVLKSALQGSDTQDGKLVPNFFVCENGIEIGFDTNDLGEGTASGGYEWVTAPFSVENLKKHQTNSDFWTKI